MNQVYGSVIKCLLDSIEETGSIRLSFNDGPLSKVGSEYPILTKEILLKDEKLFVTKNNELIKKIKFELAEKGVDATIVNSDSVDGALNLELVLSSLSKSDEEPLKLISRSVKKVKTKKVRLSIADSVKGHFNGRSLSNGTVDFGQEVIYKILKKKTFKSISHEFRHQMFNAQRKMGKRTIFDTLFKVEPESKLNLYSNTVDIPSGSYSHLMSVEELYNIAFDLNYLRRKIEKSESLAELKEHLKYLNSSSERAVALSKNAKKLSANAFKNLKPHQWVADLLKGDWITFLDGHGRKVSMMMSKESKKLAQKHFLKNAKNTFENTKRNDYLMRNFKDDYKRFYDFLHSQPNRSDFKIFKEKMRKEGKISSWKKFQALVVPKMSKKLRAALESEVKTKLFDLNHFSKKYHEQAQIVHRYTLKYDAWIKANVKDISDFKKASNYRKAIYELRLMSQQANQ